MRTRTEKFPSSYLCFPSISTQTTAEHPPDRSLKYDDCSEKCVDRFGNHGTISLSIQKDTVKIIFQAFYRRIWKMSAGVRDGRFEFTNSSVRPYRIKKKKIRKPVFVYDQKQTDADISWRAQLGVAKFVRRRVINETPPGQSDFLQYKKQTCGTWSA